MTIGAHDTLRQKVGETRVGRPPIRDTDHVGDLFARVLERNMKEISAVRVQISLASSSVERLKNAVPPTDEQQLIALGQTASCAFAAIAVLGAPLVGQLLEALSGGDPSSGSQLTPRNFTAIDETLCEDFAKIVMEGFDQAIAPPPRMKGEQLVFTYFVRKLSAILDAPDDTDMLRYRLSLKFGRSDTSYEMSLLVPLNVLEVLQPGDDTATRVLRATAADRNWQNAMIRAAATSRLKLTCVLSQLDMSIEDIGKLSSGAMITLPPDQTMDVELRLDSPGTQDDQAVIATGRLGASSGKRAMRVTQQPDPQLVQLLGPVASLPQA